MSVSLQHILRATEGWLELGCAPLAEKELNRLPESVQTTREVMKLKCRVAAVAKNWAELHLFAATCAMQRPKEPAFAEYWAWAEHKMGRSANAYSILSMAAEKFDRTWRTCYYMACFSYRLNRVREATEWLATALKMHPNPVRLNQDVRTEPDLEPLWNFLSEDDA